jgi:hypothetical protein
MPQDKQPTPAMRALKSVAPSIKSIGMALGNPQKKKKRPEDTEEEVPLFDRMVHKAKRYFNPRAKDVNLPRR